MSRKNKYMVQWACGECNNECLPVTLESRCLCGHRCKQHDLGNPKASCTSPRCPCKGFFYIVAEGAWVLRCRCKHKHIEHDCSKAPYPCIKCKDCKVFDSPWVCNCGHSWGEHFQTIVDYEVKRGITIAKEKEDSTEDIATGLAEALAIEETATSLSPALSRKIYSMRQDGIDK